MDDGDRRPIAGTRGQSVMRNVDVVERTAILAAGRHTWQQLDLRLIRAHACGTERPGRTVACMQRICSLGFVIGY